MSRQPLPPKWPAGTLTSNLGAQLAGRLVNLGAACTFKHREQLLGQGDSSTHVFVLLSGIVKVTAETANGHTILLAIRIAGDVVGELAAADGQPRTATVTSCGKVLCRRIPAADWRDFLTSDPTAHSALNQTLSQRFRAETERRVEFTEQPAPVRIARVLLAFERSYGRDTLHGRELAFPLSQSELAAAADCALGSVQNTLAAMRRQGVVETRYLGFIVRDPQALALWPLPR